MLINIHELSSLASIFKMTGLLSTVSSKLESVMVKDHRRAPLCCIIVHSEHMFGYWFLKKDADWTESCPANDPGYQILQVSLAFIPSPIFMHQINMPIMHQIAGDRIPKGRADNSRKPKQCLTKQCPTNGGSLSWGIN